MKRLIAFSAVCFLIIFSWTLDCSALILPISNEQLILESRDIIHGIVKEVRCEWNKNHTWIHTYVTLEVIDVFKGEPQDEIILQIQGGTIKNPNTSLIDSVTKKIISDTSKNFVFRGGGGDTTLWVEDEAELEEGMDVIIHTYLTENGNLVINCGERGVYTVNNGVVEELNMTIEQFRNLVTEVKMGKDVE
jgi:hypothetical protein